MLTYLFAETSKLCRFFVKSILTLTGLFMFFFDALTWFLVVLSTYGISILCVRSITVSGISTFESLQIPIIFSKSLSLVLLFSVGIPSNLRHNLLSYCSSSSISCWFYKFCCLISKIRCWSMILSDSSSSILLFCFFSSFVNCNSTSFQNFSNRFSYNSLIFCPGYKTVPQYNFLTHQFFDPCLSYALFS